MTKKMVKEHNKRQSALDKIKLPLKSSKSSKVSKPTTETKLTLPKSHGFDENLMAREVKEIRV